MSSEVPPSVVLILVLAPFSNRLEDEYEILPRTVSVYDEHACCEEAGQEDDPGQQKKRRIKLRLIRSRPIADGFG